MKYSSFISVIAFFLVIPATFAVTKAPCGLTTTECSESKQSTSKNTWTLIARTTAGTELWKDEDSGLIWGARLDQLYRFWSTVEVNAVGAINEELICKEKVSLEKRGNLTNLKWRMPTHKDFENAEDHGIRQILPSIRGHWYWSSTVAQTGRRGRGSYGFNGTNGDLDFIDEWLSLNSVVCVAN